jgi:hypothetical protein
MKKILVFSLLLSCLYFGAFADSESMVGLGPGLDSSFGSKTVQEETIENNLIAPGIVFDDYVFWNKKDIGLFTNIAFLFPLSGQFDIADLEDYKILFQFNMMIGPGFRFNLTDKLLLKTGVGLNYMQSIGTFRAPVFIGQGFTSTMSYLMIAFNLGIGGDIGLKFDFTDNIFLGVGSTVAYNFLSYTSVSSEYTDVRTRSGWDSSYSMINIRPYLCIGMNFWTEGSLFNRKSGFGKLK